MRALLLLLVATLAFAPPAAAQPAAPKPQRREKIKQKIRALRAYTLTEQLDLDEATAAKLFPLLSKFDEEFDKLLQARADLQHRLSDAPANKDGKAVDKLVDDAIANQKQLWSTEERRLAELRKILTPQQVARVLVVLPAMERRIQNQLKRAAQKQDRSGSGAGAGPRDPEDSDTGTVDPFSAHPRNKTRD